MGIVCVMHLAANLQGVVHVHMLPVQIHHLATCVCESLFISIILVLLAL